MPLRVNPILLLSLITTLILSFGIFASAIGGGTAGDALAAGMAQMGKPHVEGTDGPDAFSCTGLIRYMLRTAGVDSNAPWSPEAYLGTYAPVDPANLQPGDVVIYPGWATMYAGDGMLLNSNAVLGYVTETPMSEAGTPEGIVRPPYGGGQQTPGLMTSDSTTTPTPTTTGTDPAAGQGQAQYDLTAPTTPIDPAVTGQGQVPSNSTMTPTTGIAPAAGQGQAQYDPMMLAAPSDPASTPPAPSQPNTPAPLQNDGSQPPPASPAPMQ